MKITLLAVGTRGDVQPSLALAKSLEKRGHQVKLLVGANFRHALEQQGFRMAPSQGDVAEIMAGEIGREWARIGNNPIKQIKVLKRLMDSTADPLMKDGLEACRDADLILSGFVTDVYAHTFGEYLKKPVASIRLQPSLVATHSGAATMNTPWPSVDGLRNFIFGKLLLERSYWKIWKKPVSRFRKDVLNIPPTTNRELMQFWKKSLVIHAYSPTVVPHPRDWPQNYHTVGYYFYDEEPWQPSAELKAFLDKGERPIAISFGSMPSDDARELTLLLLRAVEKSRKRVVLLSGWAGLGQKELPPTVFPLDYVPFSQFLPMVSGLVHHGGAGTTASGFLAGVPMLAIPHLGDQPFWGKKIELLGCGPAPLRRDRLTAEALAESLQALSLPKYAQNAGIVRDKLRKEDGITCTVELLERNFP